MTHNLLEAVTLATVSLNQWAMDFEGNLKRILESIDISVERHASYRLGPELEITGYGCEDHFFEPDTILHSWEVLCQIVRHSENLDIIVETGMPVFHAGARYNCRIILYNGKIILIRPKMVLAEGNNYREHRWFAPWTKRCKVEHYTLPEFVSAVTGQAAVPFGDALIDTLDTCLAQEVCEEMWAVTGSTTLQTLHGCELFFNGSGSHFQYKKHSIRVSLMISSTMRNGGVYAFSNLMGCDGSRVLFDGCCGMSMNGKMVLTGPQFSLEQVVVETYSFSLDDIRSYRGSSLGNAMKLSHDNHTEYPRVKVSCRLTRPTSHPPSLVVPAERTVLSNEEELRYATGLWLWDYLRRSGSGGFLLPLSGGVDSSASACCVYSMCCWLFEELQNSNTFILSELRRVVNDDAFTPSSAKDICRQILVTCYLPSDNSSLTTKSRSEKLAREITSFHLNIPIATVVSALVFLFTSVTGFEPMYAVHGGSKTEDLALQNVQARVRMVVSYLFAQLLSVTRGKPTGLLVLGSANVDEALRGYMTKYDCSSADINPIGGISKTDLVRFAKYCSTKFELASLEDIITAPPTAELKPLRDGEAEQTDEADMGMTYDELSLFGTLRKTYFCGPYSMFLRLKSHWGDIYSLAEVAGKVKSFFYYYALNRHKLTVLTPSVHIVDYSPDDNRYDLRQFLYNVRWPWQFARIDEAVSRSCPDDDVK